MTAFYVTIISTYVFSLFARIAYDKKIRVMAIFWFILILGMLITISGLRNGIGDTGVYMNSYRQLAQNSIEFNLTILFFVDGESINLKNLLFKLLSSSMLSFSL